MIGSLFRSRAFHAPLFTLGLAVLVSACDILSFGARNRPESLRVQITAEGLEDFALENSPIPLVTSRNFVFGQPSEGEEPEMLLLASDTVLVDLPLDRTFDLAPNYALLVRFLPPDDLPEETPPEEAPVYTLRAIVDGREVFLGSQPMFPGSYIEYFVRHSL